MKLDFKFIDDFTNSKYYQEVIECRSNILFNPSSSILYFYLDDLEDDLNSYHYSAFEGENLIGYVRLSVKGDTAKLSRIFVKNEYSGKGVGYKMLYSLLKVCSEKKISEIVLYSRIDTINFYKKLGFISTTDFMISPTSGLKLNKMIFRINS